MSRILVVDDDAAGARTLQLYLKSRGHTVDVKHCVDDALRAVDAQRPDLVVMDIRMPERSGLEGLMELKRTEPSVPVIMITAFHDMDSTIEAMQQGAEDYIHKPIDVDELDESIGKALERGGAPIALSSAQSPESAPSMAGRSRAIKEVFKTIGRVGNAGATVLITGESGTGKELVARALHRAGANPDGPFVVVNCAALVETLLESDMFGHERGAFTGAVTRQPGKFALARGGTILLDEIGELPSTMQAKLLRVLHDKEFTPLGAQRVERTDARLLAATNADLAQRVRDGTFREDLYFRLQVVNIHLPPLRERLEDLPDLVQTLIGRISTGQGLQIAADIMDCFRAHQWPGNVRELENRLIKAAALCSGGLLTADLFPDLCADGRGKRDARPGGSDARALDLTLAEVEKRHVQRVLDGTGWHRGRACEVLGISRPRLRRLIEAHGLTPPGDVSGDAAAVEPD